VTNRTDIPDELLPEEEELPELPELPDVPEFPGGGAWPDEIDPDELLLHGIETQMRRVQAFAESAAELFALGRASAAKGPPAQLAAPPQLDRVPGDVLAELSCVGDQLMTTIEAAFEGAGRGRQRSAVRQYADLICQRVAPPPTT